MSEQVFQPSPEPERPKVALALDQCTPFPYPKKEYARRILWELCFRVLYPLAPGRLVGWRIFWLRLFGAKLPRSVNIRPGVRVQHPWLLSMGEYSALGDRVTVYNLGPISIGEHTVISQNAHLCNGTHDYRDPSLPLIRPTMSIGSGVWVCADAFIGPGVTVGDNTIVGARAVVTRDLPPWVIASGNPAQIVKDRPVPLPPEQRSRPTGPVVPTDRTRNTQPRTSEAGTTS